MPINDTFMLPKQVRTMAQMADLLQAEQTELTQTQRTIAALEPALSCSPAMSACSSCRSTLRKAWKHGGPRCWQS